MDEQDLDERKRLRRRQKLRKILLYKLINDILKGKVNTSPTQLNNLYNELGGSRREYHSPEDRSSYNYGYMEIRELPAGTPTIW